MNLIVAVHIPSYGIVYRMNSVRDAADWVSMRSNIFSSNPEHWPDVVYEYESGKQVTIGRKRYLGRD